MGRPQHIALVAQAMQPVIAKVIDHEGQQPYPPRIAGQTPQGHVLPGQCISDQPYSLGQQPGAGGQHPRAQAVDRIGQGEIALAARVVGDKLYGNQHEEKRHGQQNQVHGRWPRRVSMEIRMRPEQSLSPHLPN
ncbi:hypothetical protein D3C81_1855330 [compost metagenome]